MKTASVFLLAILSFGCGYSSPKAAPAQAGIVPVIAAIIPNTANHGDPGFTLTVNGNSFNGKRSGELERDGANQHSPPSHEPAYRGDPRFSHRRGWHCGGHGNQPRQQYPRRSVW